MKFKLARFEDNAADIITEIGTNIGWVERVYGEVFRSESSRARTKFISHYEVNLRDDDNADTDFKTLDEAKAYIAGWLGNDRCN